MRGRSSGINPNEIEFLISIWSMRPPPLSEAGKAWEDGARQGWEWAMSRMNALTEKGEGTKMLTTPTWRE